MKKSADFTFEDESKVYVVKLKKRNYWWLLLLLLLFLPLLLLIRFKKDVVFKTINVKDNTVLQGTFVDFSFNDHHFFDFKTKKFFVTDTIRNQDTTNNLGLVVFKDVSYSLYAKIFHSGDFSIVTATNRCFLGDSLKPKFFDLKHKKETVLKLPERVYTLDFKVIDAEDKQPIPEAKVTIKEENGNTREGVSDADGTVLFDKVAYCSSVFLIASKYGYANDTIAQGVILIKEDPKKRLFELKPVKGMVNFLVKDLLSKQPIPNVKALLIIESDTVKISTNTNGVGKGAFDDIRIISKMKLQTSRVFYFDTATQTYIVEKYIKQGESERTILMRPKAQNLTFTNIDGNTGMAMAGVSNQIAVSGKPVTTEMSNSNGTFMVAGVMPNDNISIVSTKNGFVTNSSKVRNQKLTNLDTPDKRTIPLSVTPPPPPPPPPNQVNPPPQGVVVKSCDAPQKSGGNGTTINVHSLGNSTQFTVTWDMLSLPDKITIYCGPSASGSVIYDSGGDIQGVGSRTLNCNSGYVTVKIVGGGFLTAWNYQITCL